MKDNLKVINKVTKLARLLERKAQELGHAYKCEVKILGYCAAETSAKGHKYPAHLAIKIENWSNCYYHVRLKDGRWMGDTISYKIKGDSLYTVAREMIQMLVAHKNKISPPKTNVIEFKRAK